MFFEKYYNFVIFYKMTLYNFNFLLDFYNILLYLYIASNLFFYNYINFSYTLSFVLYFYILHIFLYYFYLKI